jgi:hypothetical protein
MKQALLALVVMTGCGTVFNDPKATVEIVNPNGLKVSVDGLPVNGVYAQLDNRKDHTIVGTDKDGKVVGSCEVIAHVQARYIVGDLFLGLLPVVVDALTGDWSQVEDTRCVL